MQLDSLLDGTDKRQSQISETGPVSRQELERRSRTGRRPSGDTRERLTDDRMYTSLSLDEDAYTKIRLIARLNGQPYRDLVNATLRKYVELYEKRHGPVEQVKKPEISADSLI